jgi:hypothetical protein
MLKKLLILVALAGIGAVVAKKLLGGPESDEWEDIEAWEAPQYPPVPEPAAEAAAEVAEEAADEVAAGDDTAEKA